MANLVRREPREVMSLRDAMDRLFDESFLQPFGMLGSAQGLFQPAVDVCETDKEIVVTAAVPGLKPDDLHVSLTGDLLELQGEMQTETERQDATYHLRERRAGRFRRTLALPAPVLADKARAEFENGVLTLTLPKADQARRKTLTIRTKK